jgi:hypothetical protein
MMGYGPSETSANKVSRGKNDGLGETTATTVSRDKSIGILE